MSEGRIGVCRRGKAICDVGENEKSSDSSRTRLCREIAPSTVLVDVLETARVQVLEQSVDEGEGLAVE